MASIRKTSCHGLRFLAFSLFAALVPRIVAAVEIDVTPRRVDAVPPGTVIPDRAPKGWTHLIIRSHPRIGEEASKEVSPTTVRMASFLFTTIIADVRADRRAEAASRFYLSKVAVGVGTRVNGQFMVLSGDTHEKLGAKLGFLDRMVLGGGEAQVKKIRYVARSRTMALIDCPSVLARNGKHTRVLLRYAVIVDPETGCLETLVWLLVPDEKGGYTGPVGPVQWLAQNMVEDCILRVDSGEFILGFPTEIAFAVERIPRGRIALEPSGEFKRNAAKTPLTPALAESLHRQLGRAMSRSSARQ